MNVPKNWKKTAEEAADRVGRVLGVPDLSAEDAAQFAALGRPDMKVMIGRPVGITPEAYEDFLQKKSQSSGYTGCDLDFILDLVLGKHLNGSFLSGVD